MNILSWNVNGIRAIEKKGFLEWFLKEKPDILCLQEIKADEGQVPEKLKEIPGYFLYFNPARKKGYSGTAVYTKIKPKKIETKIGFKQFDEEGRFLRMDFKDFILINFYIPHGGREKENLKYKLKFYDYLICYLKKIKRKPIILGGDFNIAHKDIDLRRPKDNKDNIMFTPAERARIDAIIDLGFIDTFRHFHKDSGHYTWWAYFNFARQRDIGWRIDYFFISMPLEKKLKDSFILDKVMGSDHCPVGIEVF